MNVEASGGIFPEKLVHEVDVFRWTVGEVEAVQCFGADNVLPQSPYPDCLQAPSDVLRTMALTFTAERAVQSGERETVEYE